MSKRTAVQNAAPAGWWYHSPTDTWYRDGQGPKGGR